MLQQTRNKIFISYSHKDTIWLDELRKRLDPIVQGSEISPWSDKHIDAGEEWRKEIEAAMDAACLAVLLMTPDFLSSSFIRDFELPRLMKAQTNKELTILWVPCRAVPIEHIEVGKLQALHNPQKPLQSLSVSDLDAALVDISIQIKAIARPKPPPTPAGQSAPLETVRTFDVPLANRCTVISDEEGRLWVSDGEQVLLFRVGHEGPISRQLLPNRRWKQTLSQLWHGRLVLSDWKGAVYAVDEQSQPDGPPMHAGGAEDLPVHLMAVGPEGDLVGAAWDGTILRWGSDGSPIGPRLKIPFLPTHLIPLPDRALAVADQGGNLRMFDAEGAEFWSWRADEPLREVWLIDGGSTCVFGAWIGRNSLNEIRVNRRSVERVAIPGSIVKLSRQARSDRGAWMAIATEGGNIDWMPRAPFHVAKARVSTGFSIRDILAVYDPLQTANRILLGLTNDGQAFLVRDEMVTTFHTPAGIRRFGVDKTGHFLFLISDSQIHVCRNPAVRARFKVEVAEVKGSLRVQTSQKLVIVLENQASVPIFKVTANLSSKGTIEECTHSNEPGVPVSPGSRFELHFNVFALRAGELALILRLELEDEGGPPTQALEMKIPVTSNVP